MDFTFAYNPTEERPKVANSFIDDSISPICLYESEGQLAPDGLAANKHLGNPSPTVLWHVVFDKLQK